MPDRPASHTRWLLVFWLFVLSAVAFLDRVNISIAGGSIASEFGLTNVQLGWVFSSFLLGYALFQTPGGWLSDRLGPRRVLTAGVIWWGVFTALTAMVPSKCGRRVAFFCSHAFSPGGRRSHHLSGLESLRIVVDSHSGKRDRQRHHLRRRRCGSGNYAASYQLCDVPLRMALVILAECHHRASGWCGVVRVGTGQTRRAPIGFCRRIGIH